MFHEARAPGIEELQAVLAKIITRILRLLTRQGLLIEEQGMTYLAEPHSDTALTPLAKRLPAPTVSHWGHAQDRRC